VSGQLELPGGGRTNTALAIRSLRIAILTVSDTRDGRLFHLAKPRLCGMVKGYVGFLSAGLQRRLQGRWDRVIRWQLDSRHRPCNLAELIVRFAEIRRIFAATSRACA
jgi:hypothetical protein